MESKFKIGDKVKLEFYVIAHDGDVITIECASNGEEMWFEEDRLVDAIRTPRQIKAARKKELTAKIAELDKSLKEAKKELNEL